MAKALQIEGMANSAKELERKVDRFLHGHSVSSEVGKAMETALNDLATVRSSLNEATLLRALEELKQREEEKD